MYICPICNKEFDKEEKLVKHFSTCWKEKNPYHQSKEAPRSEDVVTRIVNDDIINFFNFIERKDNGRNISKNSSYCD